MSLFQDGGKSGVMFEGAKPSRKADIVADVSLAIERRDIDELKRLLEICRQKGMSRTVERISKILYGKIEK